MMEGSTYESTYRGDAARCGSRIRRDLRPLDGAAVFLGWVNLTFVGKSVSFPDPQWGQVVWSILLAAIWFWVADGFWNMRAYAW